jgi:hypothetical protein
MTQHIQLSRTTSVPMALAYWKSTVVYRKMRCKNVVCVRIDLPTNQYMRFEFLTVMNIKILEEPSASFFRSHFVICIGT